MVSRPKSATLGAWVPTADQIRAMDCLALGLSQSAIERQTGIPQETISRWCNRDACAPMFRAEVARRARLFADNLEVIETQQVVQATAVVGAALAGEVQRDAHGELPIEWLTAVNLLRATRWKAIARTRYEKQRTATPNEDC